MTQDSLDYSKTYIAFDSGCGECSAISHSLEQETNGKLLARPLSDPEVEQIRINHFGPNPPHIPVAITFNRTTPKVCVLPQRYAQARGLLLSWPAALARLRPFCWPELSEFTAIMNI